MENRERPREEEEVHAEITKTGAFAQRANRPLCPAFLLHTSQAHAIHSRTSQE